MAQSLANPESEGTVTVIGKSEASWRLRAVAYSILGCFLLALQYPHLPLRYHPPAVTTAWAVWALSLLTWLIVIWVLCPRLREGRDGIAFMILLPQLVVMFFVRELPCAREKADTAICSSNLKAIATAFSMYAQDHGNRLPKKTTWEKSIRPYLRNREALSCPKDFSNAPVSYAMNEALSSVSMDDLAEPAKTVLLFDCLPATRGAGSGPTDMAARHSGCPNVAFVDGRVMYANPHTQKKLRWKP